MLKFIAVVVVSFYLLPQAAFGYESDEQFAAFAGKVVAHILKVGHKQAFEDFSTPGGEFTRGDVYVATLNMEGLLLFHPVNPRLTGKNVLSLRDTSGKFFIKDVINALASDSAVWIEYDWINPTTQKIATKRTLARKIDDMSFVMIGYWP